jgi:hypothetical protein
MWRVDMSDWKIVDGIIGASLLLVLLILWYLDETARRDGDDE